MLNLMTIYPWVQSIRVPLPIKNNRNLLEMQQYIDISPYRDTLGGDTVSIHI